MSYLLIVISVYLLLECVYAAQHVDRRSRLCVLLKLVFAVTASLYAIVEGVQLLQGKCTPEYGFIAAMCALALTWLPVTYYRFVQHFDRRVS